MSVIKFGDRKTKPCYSGDDKAYCLEFFVHLTELDEEKAIVDLKKKQRDVNEKAKRRF